MLLSLNAYTSTVATVCLDLVSVNSVSDADRTELTLNLCISQVNTDFFQNNTTNHIPILCINNIIMYTITKRPIFILSSPRTGSTMLGRYIKKICEDPTMRYFHEPEAERNEHRLNNLQRYICEHNNYVVKTHAQNLHKYPRYLIDFFTTSESVFKIRIQRRSFVDQVASRYIAIKRGKKWHYNKKNEANFVSETIDIDKKMLEHNVRFIYRCNESLKNSQINFDLDLYYEDLPVIDNLETYKTPKPLNHQVLLDTTKEIILELQAKHAKYSLLPLW